MKYLITLFLVTFLSISSFSQQLDLDILIKAYNSGSILNAYQTLKKSNNFSDKVSIKMVLEDSTIFLYFGSDSLNARKSRNKITFSCSAFSNENQFINLKAKIEKKLFFIEAAKGESGGVLRDHFVYAVSKKLKKGELQIILSKCFDIQKKQTYYSLHIFPSDGY